VLALGILATLKIIIYCKEMLTMVLMFAMLGIYTETAGSVKTWFSGLSVSN